MYLLSCGGLALSLSPCFISFHAVQSIVVRIIALCWEKKGARERETKSSRAQDMEGRKERAGDGREQNGGENCKAYSTYFYVCRRSSGENLV